MRHQHGLRVHPAQDPGRVLIAGDHAGGPACPARELAGRHLADILGVDAERVRDVKGPRRARGHGTRRMGEVGMDTANTAAAHASRHLPRLQLGRTRRQQFALG